jgi:hypothetical protein
LGPSRTKGFNQIHHRRTSNREGRIIAVPDGQDVPTYHAVAVKVRRPDKVPTDLVQNSIFGPIWQLKAPFLLYRCQKSFPKCALGGDGLGVLEEGVEGGD